MAEAQPKFQLTTSPDYRENYANSVQMRVTLWDFFLLFGIVSQTAPDTVTVQSFQGVYLSPPQAKAVFNLLKEKLREYEAACGEIRIAEQRSGEIIQ